MSVGSELREAREAAGLSADEVGDRTKIPPNKIEAVENDRFDSLPEGIYLDGLIRAYAREVGIDADLLIKRARVERARFAAAPGIAPNGLGMFPSEEAQTPPDLPTPSASAEPRVPASPPVSPTPVSPTPVSQPPVSAPPPVAAAPPAVSKPPPRPSLPMTLLLDDSLDSLNDVQLLPLAVDPPPVLRPTRKAGPPPPPRRRGGLALALMTMLAIAGWAAAFYESSRHGANQVSVADAGMPTTRTEEFAETRPAAPSVAEPPAIIDSSPSTSQRGTVGVAGTAGTERVSPETGPRVESPNDSGEPTTAAVGRGVNVSGAWALATQVERSGDTSLEGDVIEYEIQLQQAGTRISGNGRRTSENGQPVGSAEQTPISLSGTIHGERMTLAFTQTGSRPMSQGKLILVVNGSTGMQGRFSSADAQSSGIVEAHRLP